MSRRVNVQMRDGVALLTLDGAEAAPRGSGFDVALRRSLEAALGEACAAPGLQAIVLRAGAGGWPRAQDPAGDYGPEQPTLATICDRLARVAVPVVAVLSGMISGGALALTQAAGLRLAMATTRFHSPEASLNLMPTAGGTVRLVRRAGPAAALEVLLSGRVFRAEEAMALGLCDAVASAGTIETAALTEALRVAGLGADAPFSPRDGALADPAAALDALAAARERFPARADLPVTTRLAQVAEAALLLPLQAALDFEAVAHDDLLRSETTAALRSLARAQAEAQTLAGVPAAGIVPVARVALWNPTAGRVVALLRRGLAVQIGTSDPGRLPPLLTEIARAQEQATAEGRLDPARREADWARLEPVSGPDGFGPTDLMIATPTSTEEREVLRLALPPGAVLALSGTAPWPGELGIDRSQGLAAIWAAAAGQTADLPRLAAVLRAGGIRVIHATALALRLEAAFLCAADRTVLAGAAPQAVDAALTRWGFAEGPFARFGRIGADLAGTRLAAAGRRQGPVLATLAVLGGVSGAEAALAALRAEAGIVPRPFSEAEIVARTLAELAGLGLAALEARKAFRPGDIDLMAGAELGFPAHRGGPMFQADRIGAIALRKRLRGLAAEGAPPAPALLDLLIRDGQTLAERFT